MRLRLDEAACLLPLPLPIKDRGEKASEGVGVYLEELRKGTEDGTGDLSDIDGL